MAPISRAAVPHHAHPQSVLKIKHPKLSSGPRMLREAVVRDQLMASNPGSQRKSLLSATPHALSCSLCFSPMSLTEQCLQPWPLRGASTKDCRALIWWAVLHPSLQALQKKGRQCPAWVSKKSVCRLPSMSHPGLEAP